MHVGCTVHNEEHYKYFILFYSKLKLAIECKIFLKIGVRSQGGANMAIMLVMA